jgi:tetratricopeptide (TPR) repeat protein/GTPase SAR1 family protein
LQEVLQEKKEFYHIVHFDGHGGYGIPIGGNHHSGGLFSGAQGELVFEKQSGGADEIPADKLAALLRQYQIPIMVLNACQSAMADGDANDIFACVAASLIRAGIRSVVAMQYSLYVGGARVFVPEFYKRLFEASSVTEAIQQGRRAMYLRQERICLTGFEKLEDWLVPVLYQQGTDIDVLPKLNKKSGTLILKDETYNNLREFPRLGDYGFIGREAAIRKLEEILQRQKAAGILIHGMAGIGKTTLVNGFLRWLVDTHYEFMGAFWFDFREIRSIEYLVNQVLQQFVDYSALARPLEDKVKLVASILYQNPCFMIWDNFESAFGVDLGAVHSDTSDTAVSGNLQEEDRVLIHSLLKQLRGGKSNVLITSRGSEEWLTPQECFRFPTLGGLQGDEVWEYCQEVVEDLGLRIERRDEIYRQLIEKLDGNPLAIRAILLRLNKVSAEKLFQELNQEFHGIEGDEATERIEAAFRVFRHGIAEKYAPVIQAIALQEHYLDIDILEFVLSESGYFFTEDEIMKCMQILETAGFCSQLDIRFYQMHPALRGGIRSVYSCIAEPLERNFVIVMRYIWNGIQELEPHVFRNIYSIHESNFHQAKAIALRIEMKEEECAILECIAYNALESRLYIKTNELYQELAAKYENYKLTELVAVPYHQLGRVAKEQRKYEEAETWYQKSLEISEKQGNEHGSALTYHQLGMIAEERRKYEEAETWYRRSLEINEKQGKEYGAASTYHQLGSIAEEQRKYEEAETWYRKSLEIFEKQGKEHEAAATYHQLGIIAQEQRKYEEAEIWYRKSLEIKEKQGYE